jgi:hypothetical protein
VSGEGERVGRFVTPDGHALGIHGIKMNKLRWFGIALVILGVLGFFTVADDLRHKGELMGVSSVLLLGIVILAWVWWRGSWKR